MRIDREEFEKSLPNIVRFLDEPVAASSIVPMYLNPKPVGKLLAEHQLRRQDNQKLLFSLVIFEEWLRAASSH